MSTLSSLTAERPLLLVGCGRMGGALLSGWRHQGLAADAVWVVEPSGQQHPAVAEDHWRASLQDLPRSLKPAVVVLAVKPQVMDEAIEGLSGTASALYLSIAAGKSLKYFAERLGATAAVVRAMPNTPAAIGKGATVAVANAKVTAAGRDLASALLAAAGSVHWIKDEGLMDAVTAVSGSGPAYVFYLTECLAAAGVQAGLPQELARALAQETVAGAGALLAEDGADPAALRQAVTSPAGTTAAALDVLMDDDGLRPLLGKAVMAAARRSRELG
jgi:pyrroline-5-carboxylate reductase